MDFESFPQKSGAGVNRLRPNGLDQPRLDRFAPDAPGYTEAMARHGEAMLNNAAGYLDPITGLFVMTAGHLVDRGYCCDRGCRHCPYDPLPSASS